MPRRKKQAVTSTIDLQATWELHYVSYFLRVYKKLFNVKKAYTAELLEKELNYDAIQVQFGEEIAKVVEFLTGREDLGATSWEPVLEEQMREDAIHPNILKGTNFNLLDPEQRLQLLKIVVDLIRNSKDQELVEFGRNLKSKSLRFKAVGKDKDENRYWTFGSSRLFREFSKPNSKRFEPVCSTPNEWEGFILTLRPSPHKSERELHKSLKHVWGKIKDHIHYTQLKMKGHLELSQMAVKEHFELKRHAEAIEALESNFDTPKMTNIGKFAKKTKPSLNDGIVTPPLSNSHKLSNGPEKGMFVKKKKKNIKPKMKREENHFLKPNKAKAKLSRSDSSSSNSDGPVMKKPKRSEEQKPKFSEPKKSDEDDIPEELRRKIENDDPGIDLSIFKPPEKRKCVLELEKRKGKTWYEADDDASDEDLNTEDFSKGKEVPAKKKKRKKVKTPPPVMPEPSPILAAPLPPFKSYVFSTALANRGAYEVIIKGRYNTIIAYHQAQKWLKPHLQQHIHCEPFVPEVLKTESTVYSSDNGLRNSFSEEEKKPIKKKPQKRPRKKPQKKVQRKISDASFSASTPSPPMVNRRRERDMFPSGRENVPSKLESSSSDRENENSGNESDLYNSKQTKKSVESSRIFEDDEDGVDFIAKHKQLMKNWSKRRNSDKNSDHYEDYDPYVHNNNHKSGNSKNSRLFPHKKLQNSKVLTKGQKKQNFSNPRPSPLNQPTSLSKIHSIPDQLSEDDEDDEDEENSASSENEAMGEEPYIEDRCNDNMPRSPPEREIEDAKSPTEQLMERHIHPLKNSAPEPDKQSDQVNECTKSTNSLNQERETEQGTAVISSIKTNATMPLKVSGSYEALSGSPRDTPQLSPFASYPCRSATYPADIINPKPGQTTSPHRSIDKDRNSEADSVKIHDNGLQSPGSVIEVSPSEGSNPGMPRPTTLHLGSKASPPQQTHPQLTNTDPKRPKSMHIPHMSPHQMEVSSVIQRQNPSPSSSVDNLCSPAIPVHKMQSPSIPVKPPSSSPIIIHDTVNGSHRSISPTSPAIVNKSLGPYSSGVHSIISPVITNHKSPPISRNSPSVQPMSSAGFSCAVQRPTSPSQLNNSIQRLHATQQDHSLQAALYQRHRLPQLPASLKTGLRGTPTALDDEKGLPGMMYNQQLRAYQAMQHGIPKELNHNVRGFAQASQESGHNFHGISGHGSQDTPRTIHPPVHGVPESLKSHLAMQRSSAGESNRTLHGIPHDNEDQARTYLGIPHGVPEPTRSHHGLPRVAQSSPRSHIGLPSHSQDASRTILGLTQSAQEVTRNVLGSSQESARPHHSAPPSASESSRSHHGLPINAQELSRTHHAFTHAVHDQQRYPPGMTHPFHLNRTLHESAHGRSLRDVAHSVRPGIHSHSFQQGFRSITESPVGKSPPTQSLFQHPHGREFASPSTGTKAYQSVLMERVMLEHQQARLLEQQQQSKKSFSVESLTSSSDANERSKGQCLNGQPNSVSALSRAGYTAQQRSHMFGHLPGYTRGASPEFLKLPPHVQQMYSARGLSPYMNYPHFKG